MSTEPEGWWAYVDRITSGVPQKDVAEAAGLDPSGVSRWKSGKTKIPHVEKIVQFARKMGDSPLNALVAVGYLTPDEAASDVVQVGTSLNDFRDDAIVDEIRGRLHRLDQMKSDLERATGQLSRQSMGIEQSEERSQ
jgi:transcriptional regulator with XRE-family HTH domain